MSEVDEPDALAASTRPEQPELRRSSRDPEQLRAGLERWLATVLPGGANPVVAPIQQETANGLSSETVLFEASWTEGVETHEEHLVARLAPPHSDVPVFPTYDLAGQAQVLRLVRSKSTVPVPLVRWEESDPFVLGTPFFVMDRVDGQVPPDVMPYNFGDSWLFDASEDQKRLLQSSTVELLAELHRIEDPENVFSFLAPPEPGATALERHFAHTASWYDFVAQSGRSNLIERGLRRLSEQIPAMPGPTVLIWGDARVGNVIYRDFHPVAVLDWEMAGLGPPELDLAWLVYSHRVFEDMATAFGFPGMPSFLVREDVVDAYERSTGYEIKDFDWFCLYSAVRWAIVFLRVAQRQVHFGERDALPQDGDEVLHNRESLEAMLAGTYWS